MILIWNPRVNLNIKNTTDTTRSALYLDLYVIDSKSQLRTKVFDKRDYINFPIVNFPFTKWICCNISTAPAYWVCISQLIWYSRAYGSYHYFPFDIFKLFFKVKCTLILQFSHFCWHYKSYSDGHQFHQYQQKEKLPLTSDHWKQVRSWSFAGYWYSSPPSLDNWMSNGNAAINKAMKSSDLLPCLLIK